MRFEIMAKTMEGEVCPTGEEFECADALGFVDELALRQPFNRCQAGKQDETMRVISVAVARLPWKPVALKVEGRTVETRAESFLLESLRVGLVRKAG